jgi:PKHD-type hydroxylase
MSNNLKQNALLANAYTIPQVFNPEQCFQLIEMAKTNPLRSGAATISDEGVENNQIRHSTNYSLRQDSLSAPYYQRIMQVFDAYNALMNFDVTTFEALQILEYGKGCFYDWHLDIGNEKFSTRKISMVLLLSKPEDFEGGKLEFRTTVDSFFPELAQGSAVLFPPYLLHRLNEVTQGVRYVMVTWAHGNAFR